MQTKEGIKIKGSSVKGAGAKGGSVRVSVCRDTKGERRVGKGNIREPECII
jgi:hypothetical protein